MKCKVLSPILVPGRGRIEAGEIVDLDVDAYDVHIKHGTVVSTEVAERMESLERELETRRKQFEAEVRQAEIDARKKAEADIAAIRNGEKPRGSKAA